MCLSWTRHSARYWRHGDSNNNTNMSKCSRSTCSVPGILPSTLTALEKGSRVGNRCEQTRKYGLRYGPSALSGGAQAGQSFRGCMGLNWSRGGGRVLQAEGLQAQSRLGSRGLQRGREKRQMSYGAAGPLSLLIVRAALPVDQLCQWLTGRCQE